MHLVDGFAESGIAIKRTRMIGVQSKKKGDNGGVKATV